MNVLDVFAGIGGMSLGLHGAGMRTVAACEIDPWKRAQYRAHFPVPVFRDIRTVSARALRGLAPIDIIAGSPPCQDASAANTNGLGIDGPETGLFREAVRLVRELRPDWVLFENVPRLRTRGYDRVAAWLEEAEYACWPLVVGADDIGANHERKRLWLIAHAIDARTGYGELARESADPFGNGLRQQCGTGAGRDTFGQETPVASFDDTHATRLGCGQGRTRGPDSGCARQQDEQRARQAEDAHTSRPGLEGPGTRAIGTGTEESEPSGLYVHGDAAGEQMGRAGQPREDILAHPWLGSLDRSVRANDGLSSRLAARLRHGYGDSVVVPLVTAIGRAIMQANKDIRAA